MYEIFNGDCIQLMSNMPDECIDMILCDLPYGLTDCKWDNVISFSELWKQYRRIVKHNGAIVLFAIQPFLTKLISSNLNEFRYIWYWKKSNVTGGQFAKIQPMRCIEEIAVFYQKKPTYNPQGLIELDKPIFKSPAKSQICTYRGIGSNQTHTNYPTHFLEFKSVGNRVHPTQKPVTLLEYLIKTYTNTGETVLDNCMGSGSTGVACINTDRNFIGIELDDNYFEIAQERIKAAANDL